MGSSSKSEIEDRSRAILKSLEAALADLRDHAAADPFSNSVVLFAIDLARRIDRGEMALDDLERIVRTVTADAFTNRANRLGAYLGETDEHINRAAIAARIERLAQGTDFDGFRRRVEESVFGIVFTAHPTFSMPLSIARTLAELACGSTSARALLDEAGRAERMAMVYSERHRPPEELTLEVEHAWSLEALDHTHGAMDALNRAIFETARAKWPERWTDLGPRLITVASWVGYDQDGRTDVSSMRAFAVRLKDKSGALARYRWALARIGDGVSPFPSSALAPIETMLDRAIQTVSHQAALLAAAESDRRRVAEFSRAMVNGRRDALVDNAPLLALIDSALGCIADDARRMELLVLRATLRAYGLGLAHVHVRLNASQLHNAIRQLIGLGADPNDPSNRRSYFNRINDLLTVVRPVAISFAAVVAEQASARRLMMTVAQMLKFVDSVTPIRFLIAETEAGFTLLAALYYARLFGVDQQVEISPLFETEEAFERGERVIEEALKSPHYRDYLIRIGRFAVQFGYSDSGRFVGQMAATFRIERLRLRLAQLLERHGLGGLEIILFNTHGESIGRGGHPGSLDDRLHYLAPMPNRAEFSSRGIRVREEVSFQGGDGYVPFLTPAAATAAIARILDFSLAEALEDSVDPIYSAPDYAAEFFATVQQRFAGLVRDNDYGALLGLYGTSMLYRSGSRPTARIREGLGTPIRIEHVSQLRAIPNNAILQQIGFLANTLYGVGAAAAKDPEMFAVMLERSPRFRRALSLVIEAMEISDLEVMRAYAHVFDPGLWLANSGRSRTTTRTRALRELAELTERMAQYDRVARVIRRLQADFDFLPELLRPADSARRRRVILLHGLKVTLIQRIALIAVGIPAFSPQQNVTRDDILARILALDVPNAVDILTRIFPIQDDNAIEPEDFGEQSEYQPEATFSYAVEHRTLFGPLVRLYELVRALGAALNHEIGAVG